jgi:putative membrane protein
MTSLLSYAHLFFAVLVLAGPILALTLLRQPFDAQIAQRLQQVDLVNGIAATLTMVVGLVRLFYFGKGANYYFHNLPFISKLALYGTATGLSLVCTLEIKRWTAPLKAGRVPAVTERKFGAMRSALRLQLACVVGMVICAVLAAKGIGSPD